MKLFRPLAILLPLFAVTGCTWYEDARFNYPWIDNVLVGLALLSALIPAMVFKKWVFKKCELSGLPGKKCWSAGWKWFFIVYAIEVIIIFLIRFGGMMMF